MKITKEFIDRGRRKHGKLTAGQIHLLTGQWVNLADWESAVMGKEIDEETARLFLKTFSAHHADRPERDRRAEFCDRRRSLMRAFGQKRTKGLLKLSENSKIG